MLAICAETQIVLPNGSSHAATNRLLCGLYGAEDFDWCEPVLNCAMPVTKLFA
jgi:hypothetical protein